MTRFVLLALSLSIGILATPASGQGGGAKAPHPKKAAYADVQDWPALAPGDISLPGFQPFRAVYDRQYKKSGGPDAGALRTDQIIIHAEPVAWDGRHAVAITLIDSGNAEYPDATARSLVQIFDAKTLEAFFETGPIPGKAKDYYLARFEAEKIHLNMVLTAEQTHQSQTIPAPAPGFGPAVWALASAKLAPDAKLRLAPLYSREGANVLSTASYGRVAGRERVTDANGVSYEAWVVETGGVIAPSSPRLKRLFLTPQPPYYLGTENVDLDTGETNRSVWLNSFQAHAE